MRNKALLLFFIVSGFLSFQGCDKDDPSPLESQNYTAFNGAMRELWSDHMQWTYATVDAYYHDQNGLQAHLDRLLKNQEDIGAALVPYYGQQAGDSLAALLTTHIQLAVPVLEAAQSANQPALEQHISQTATYSVDLLDGDFTNAIIHYDEAFDHMMETADLLAKGIALQFPDKF